MSSSRSLGAGIATLIIAVSLPHHSALAQQQNAKGAEDTARPEPLETVTVTGTSIRGAAPVGSNMVAVGQDAIEKTAAINLSSLVNTIPAISTSGSLAQGENVFSYYSPQIHSLAGSSSNTTLVIADGLRIPGGGTQFNQTDPNIIPISAIQRVEVLADGASSVYGSDAVAGVVNFITRRTFDGFESNVAYGAADSYNNVDLNMIWGHTWDTGGVYFASQYNNSSELMARDRDYTSRGDYRPVGTNNNSFQCDPTTLTVSAVSSGTVPSGAFLSPDALSPVANTPTNAPCNNSRYATIVPEQYRLNGLMKIVNDFSDRLTITGMVNFNRQHTESPQPPGGVNGGLTSVTAFGPGQGVAGQTNPFFRAPAGAPNATRESITWLPLRPDGDYGTAETQSDVAYTTINVDYDLGRDWSVTLDDALGWNRSAGNNIGTFCAACAILALNGTGQSNGSTTASNIAGQNVIALNLPLTTSNALDVWNPMSTNRTSPEVLRSLYSTNSENTNFNTTNQTRVTFQGPVFALPGGEVKVAVGAEYFWHEQTQKISGGNNTGPTTTGSNFRVYNYDRNVKSAFAEVLIPVISADMDIPFARSIDLNISGRYDEYSDVGDTTNPKYAFNWQIVESFRLRGNYATAFVAPPLAVIGDPSQGYLYASGSVGPVVSTINVPVANYPEVVNVPGAVVQNTSTPCTASSDVCTIGQGNLAMRRQLGGGFTNEVPQKGQSWSIGFDFAPEFLPGFTSAVTFFHNKYTGGVSSPSPTAIVNNRGLNNLLTICPSGCTQQQILDFANVANGASIAGSIPSTVYFLLDQSSRNALNLLLEGIDVTLSYDFQIGNLNFRVGDAASYFTKYTQNFGGGTDFDILNTSGFNTTFPSIKFRHRAQLGMQTNGFSTDLFWNHTGAYKNWSSTSVNPIVVQNGIPLGGGDDVDADNTFDLHVQYMFGESSRFKGWIVSLDVRNMLDEEPPFFNGNTGGIIGNATSWAYNGFVSNPVGRLVTLGLRTRM